jgi:hypothetical protein
MPNYYYLHHTHNTPPRPVLTDSVLDLKPGAIIHVRGDFYEVLGDRPIIQDTDDGSVHVHVEYIDEISGDNAREFWKEFSEGRFYDNEA